MNWNGSKPEGDPVDDHFAWEQGPMVITNFRLAPSTMSQPRLPLFNWRIIECHGLQNLVGFLENGITCRLTTEIAFINVIAREVRTQSGRQYDLLGPPASDPDLLSVIAVRVMVCVSTYHSDVTDEIWDAMQRVTA